MAEKEESAENLRMYLVCSFCLTVNPFLLTCSQSHYSPSRKPTLQKENSKKLTYFTAHDRKPLNSAAVYLARVDYVGVTFSDKYFKQVPDMNRTAVQSLIGADNGY